MLHCEGGKKKSADMKREGSGGGGACGSSKTWAGTREHHTIAEKREGRKEEGGKDGGAGSQITKVKGKRFSLEGGHEGKWRGRRERRRTP